MQPVSARPSAVGSSGIRLLWNVLLGLGTVSALLLCAAALAPYNLLRSWGNQLASDGSLEMFSLELYARIRPLCAVGGVGLLMLTAAGVAFAQPLQNALAGVPAGVRHYFRSLPADVRLGVRSAWSSLKQPTVWAALAAITAVSILTKIWFIGMPFGHDESYNFVVFAMKPLSIGLSDYHFPNNHLFQTLLMHLTYRLFGVHDWSVRLPAFTAGVLAAPLAFALARRWYGQIAGWLAGLSLAVLPILVTYTTTARGYPLIVFFSLLLFFLGSRLIERNNRLEWLAVVLVSALGFYTIPVFLFPFGIWLTWLVAASFWTGPSPAHYPRPQRLLNLLLASAAAAGLTLLLYLPVFRVSGVKAVFANQWVTALSRADLLPTLRVRLPEIWAEWNTALPPAAQALLAVGFILSLFARTRQRSLLPQIGLLFIPLILVVQRPNPWPRTWLFLLPLVVIWACAGWVHLAGRIAQRWPAIARFRLAATTAVLLGLLVFGATSTLSRNPLQAGRPDAAEQAVQVIKTQIQPQEIVVATAPGEAPIWYYLAKYDFSDAVLLRNTPFTRAYVIVDASLGQTLASVIAERGPDAGFFDGDSAETLFEQDTLSLVAVDANLEALQRAYPNWQP